MIRGFDSEPQRGIELSSLLISRLTTHSGWQAIVSILSDIFVFTYPFFLIRLFLSQGIFGKSERKNYAMSIFFAVILSILITMGVQSFASKQRPLYQDPTIIVSESLLHDFLPTTSFPSDHATVGFSFAFSILRLGIVFSSSLRLRGVVYVLFAIIMSIARITLGLHRPTDIIGGLAVGIVGSLITIFGLHHILSQTLFLQIITLQEKIMHCIPAKYLSVIDKNTTKDQSKDQQPTFDQ